MAKFQPLLGCINLHGIEPVDLHLGSRNCIMCGESLLLQQPIITQF